MTSNKRRLDIRDVAREAGVSVTTVSHALNNKGRIARDTRERVQRVAAELGWRPSSLARNLVNQRTGLLGLVVSSSSWETMQSGTLHYFTQLMMGATTAALTRGYALASLPVDKGLGTDIQVDGAIVVDPVSSDPLLQWLREQNSPYVTTGRDVADPDVKTWIDNDHAYGTRIVLDHLMEQGARKVALLCPTNDISFRYDIEKAYRDWCVKHGLDVEICYTQEDSMERAGYDGMTNLLSQANPPDAVFAAYSPLAFGAARAAGVAGVKVPEELMIVTTATQEVSTYQGIQSQITSLDLHPDRLGQEAARLLVALVDGQTSDLPQLVQPDLTVRGSTQRR